MDRTDRETQDFMNVESFSQLPFIRPHAPPFPKEKAAGGGGGGGGAIRLFGKEFASHNKTTTVDDDSDSTYENRIARQVQVNKETSGDNTEISSRKFECHYCCRNFPTSQALGGHQNAHKRERQQAKRAHLQSVMAHGGLVDHAHVYGLMNYSRLGSSAPTLPMAYHSWNSRSSSYGVHGSYNAHQTQPINGSPLALWRIPDANSPSLVYNRDSPLPMHHQIPLFNSKDEMMKPLSSISSSPAGSHQFRFGYEPKADMHDHVSLDLHL